MEVTILPLRLDPADEFWSSFGAIGGRRGVFLEGSPRFSSCITIRHTVKDMRNLGHVNITEIDQWPIVP